MNLGKTGHNIAKVFPGYKAGEWILAVLLFLSGCFVPGGVVFLRYSMGERFLSNVNIIFGYLAAGMFAGIGGSLVAYFRHEHNSGLMDKVVLAFILMSVYHRYEAYKRKKAGKRLHSYFSGTSRLQRIDVKRLPFMRPVVDISRETFQTWVEPALLVVLGYFMCKIHETPTGIWLILAGFSLALSENISAHFRRQKFLDLIDANIEADYWKDALEGKPPEETDGFYIAKWNREMLKQSKSGNPFSNLSDDMRNVMDEDDGSGGPEGVAA